MKQKFKIAFNYFSHFIRAYNRHGIHSPFVYDFLEQVLYNDQDLQDFKPIIQLKKNLLSDSSIIEITDLGAGSTINSNRVRQIKDIARNSSKHAKYGKLFYRMAQYFKPEQVIELGTSLGLSTLYFAKANPKIKVFSLEGCPNTQAKAVTNFSNLEISNITPILGDFSITLPLLLAENKCVDMVFFDGNHQEVPTLEYFEQAVKYTNNKSIFIFDDIHWSEGMRNAWGKIKGHHKTVVTLDLFFIGIVFFDSRLTKQDFLIRF